MNATYIGYELKRILRDPVSLFFTAGLPVFFYLIFGAAMSWGDETVGNGNVAMMIMASMAAYGAVSASVALGGMAAVERMQGWGRQLGLTPLTDGGYIAVKVTLAVLITMIPIGLVYAAGALTGASGTTSAWLLSGLILVIGSAVFALYGLIFGLAFRTEAAVSAASGSVVILGFLGNVFFPLSGTLLAIAKFTPLYGLNSLARYPITEGNIMDGTTGELSHEPLWIPLANVGGWLLVLALLATFLVRRSRSRQ
ncbi:MAG: ABC transporter permease [Actinomycetia bacterium]|nr:ABC transporter permease [Actinomycetes bacterium]